MKVLLDTCVWGGAAGTLIAAGHDVRWMGDSRAEILRDYPYLEDADITAVLKYADMQDLG